MMSKRVCKNCSFTNTNTGENGPVLTVVIYYETYSETLKGSRVILNISELMCDCMCIPPSVCRVSFERGTYLLLILKLKIGVSVRQIETLLVKWRDPV